MNKPILVIDTECGAELIWFRNIREAQSYIEPYDVDNYKIYDAEGQIISIFTNNVRKSFWNPHPGDVCLEPSNKFDVDELKRTLLQELNRTMPHLNLSGHESLNSLIRLARYPSIGDSSNSYPDFKFAFSRLPKIRLSPSRLDSILFPAICLILLYSFSYYETINDCQFHFYNNLLQKLAVCLQSTLEYSLWTLLAWRLMNGIEKLKVVKLIVVYILAIPSLFWAFVFFAAILFMSVKMPLDERETAFYKRIDPDGTITSGIYRHMPPLIHDIAYVSIERPLIENWTYRTQSLWGSEHMPSKEELHEILSPSIPPDDLLKVIFTKGKSHFEKLAMMLSNDQDHIDIKHINTHMASNTSSKKITGSGGTTKTRYEQYIDLLKIIKCKMLSYSKAADDKNYNKDKVWFVFWSAPTNDETSEAKFIVYSKTGLPPSGSSLVFNTDRRPHVPKYESCVRCVPLDLHWYIVHGVWSKRTHSLKTEPDTSYWGRLN